MFIYYHWKTWVSNGRNSSQPYTLLLIFWLFLWYLTSGGTRFIGCL